MERASRLHVARYTRCAESSCAFDRPGCRIRDILLYRNAERHDFERCFGEGVRKDARRLENRSHNGVRTPGRRSREVQVVRSRRNPLHSVLNAFDEATFGLKNILNLRESLPSAADARFRVEAWLRERQVSRAGEVLVITGRGNQSPNGVSPVRESIVALLPSLRRRGVVSEWREHSPGSFVVKLGSISSLLEAPRRKRERKPSTPIPTPRSLEGLESSTLSLLRRLAVRSLESLGVRDPASFVEAEMLAKFNSLAAGVTPGSEGEVRLRAAIKDALEQLDE
jgi:hypothetical protein